MNKKTCNACNKARQVNEFYTSNSIMFSDGRVPVCKKCLKDMIDEHNIDSVKMTLQRIDKPFIAKVWISAEQNEGDTVGNYFRMINSLQQYKNMNWSNSDFEGEQGADIYKHRFDDIDNIEEIETEDGKVISLDKDIALKFGSGFTNMEYLQMEKFYADMDSTHDINTPQLRKQLIYLCKLQIKMDRALESEESGDFKKYNDAYEAILRSSALAPKDRKNSSEQSGMRSFSAIFEEVEKSGFVEPYPIEENMDLVDVSMREYINYVRVMSGQPKLERTPIEVLEKLEKVNGAIKSLSEIYGDNDDK